MIGNKPEITVIFPILYFPYQRVSNRCFGGENGPEKISLALES
jgi:hypothetical protein